jgi:hypothetical protein
MSASMIFMANAKAALRLAASTTLVVALAGFYLVAAYEHADRVNQSKARGDQSAYLGEAKHLYANWHGLQPSRPLPRNRMPLYAACLALVYDPRLTDDEFFTVGKSLNIRLSLVLLGILYVVFRWHLPFLAAANLILVLAFGYFVFKAGYTQSELLFYTLFFLAFLASCHMIEARSGRRALLSGVLSGILIALAHLTKAAMLPFLAILLTVNVGGGAAMAVRTLTRGTGIRSEAVRRFGWRAAAAMALFVCFLGVMSPYLLNSKRVYGRYFHNVNSTFYIWYDDWASASLGTYAYGDQVGWPTLPRSLLPGPAKYWREHTVGQILTRIGLGFEDMLLRSYRTFWYFKYVAVYVLLAAALIWSSPRRLAQMVGKHRLLIVFLVLYAAVYLVLIAFYHPISGTGTTRFLLAHVAPLLFAIAYFATRTRLRETRWVVAGVTVTPLHVQLLIAATIGLDLVFTLWPRLMGTYGGF